MNVNENQGWIPRIRGQDSDRDIDAYPSRLYPSAYPYLHPSSMTDVSPSVGRRANQSHGPQA